MNEQTILTIINQNRELIGLQPLSESRLLQESARSRTIDMKENNYFAHVDNSNNNISHFVSPEYNYYALGENLAFGYQSEEDLVNAWMESPTHRANILDAQYRDTGISITKVHQKFLVAQMFGSTQSTFLEERLIAKESVAFSETATHITQGIFVVSSILFIVVLGLLILRKMKKQK
jgi:uncharacterized protein YkwD